MATFGNLYPWKVFNLKKFVKSLVSPHPLVLKREIFLTILLILFVVMFGGIGPSYAGELRDRISQFPQWQNKPPVSIAKGDLIYPKWMEGTWNVTNSLIDMVAPLAPNLITPGFESNRKYLHQPIQFNVKFEPSQNLFLKSNLIPNSIVADRAFNGLNIGRAYLGAKGVLSVKVDPNDPNRQITLLRGDKKLVSVVTSRGTETPNKNEFIATEVCQQIFQGETQIYLNEVETTTNYHWLEKENQIEADQITAIYLSPQDPDYFKGGNHPVALYRYHLKLIPVN
jgi:hypothetical protein